MKDEENESLFKSAGFWISICAFVVMMILCKCHFAGGKNRYNPSLFDKVVVITGANTGIGYITALDMAKLDPKVIILACRDAGRALGAIDKIKIATGYDRLEFMPLDLDDLVSVRKFADEFNQKYERLDILLNNAGIMALPKREVTKQGFEKQFGVNHVGHFLLTTLLLDKIKASDQGRIVNVSSLAHERGQIYFEDLSHEKKYVPWDAYQQSKLANVYFTRHLDTIFKRDGITNVKVVSLHPGVVKTELGRHMYEGKACKKYCQYCFFCCCFLIVFKTPTEGAQTSLHCCLVDFDKLESGCYYSDCKVKKETFTSDQWEKDAEKLWALSEDMVKEY